MNAWSKKGRASYAEWAPEVDLHRTRWPEEQVPEPARLRPVARAERDDLAESA